MMKNPPGFSYNDYIGLLQAVKDAGYALVRFVDASHTSGPRAIIRHDIDVSPSKALVMARREAGAGVRSTYFFMLTSQMYNLLSEDNRAAVQAILAMGHEIGLHFDAALYADTAMEDLEAAVLGDLDILKIVTGREIRSISWHIPQDRLLGQELGFLKARNIKNAYSPEFFHGCRYVSDSMMRWRDSPLDILDAEKAPAIQILTHPIWYSSAERTKKEIMTQEAGERALATIKNLAAIDTGLLVG